MKYAAARGIVDLAARGQAVPGPGGPDQDLRAWRRPLPGFTAGQSRASREPVESLTAAQPRRAEKPARRRAASAAHVRQLRRVQGPGGCLCLPRCVRSFRQRAPQKTLAVSMQGLQKMVPACPNAPVWARSPPPVSALRHARLLLALLLTHAAGGTGRGRDGRVLRRGRRGLRRR
jgi:hypothetical protein